MHSSLANATTTPCQSVTDGKGLLKCAIENHPQVLRAKRTLHQTLEKQEWAGQMPNPELSGQTLMGRSLGDSLSETEVSLVFPIPVGGTVSSMAEKAEAESRFEEAHLLSQKELAAQETVVQLHRTRQLEVELAISNETIHTFDKILKQFRSKVSLSPEQKASLNVFELVRSDFLLRRAQFLREKENVTLFFEKVSGLSYEKIQGICPKEIFWPDLEKISDDSDPDPLRGSILQLSRRSLEVAEASHDLAISESWPVLKIGPSFRYNQEGGIRFPHYGFSLSFELPIFSQNGGERAYTRAGIIGAEANLEMKSRNVRLKFKSLKTSYQLTVKALKEAADMTALTQKHHRLEKLFIRGLISPALVIEAHRQMLDYAVNQHMQEKKALELLWAFYAVRGTFQEESP